MSVRSKIDVYPLANYIISPAVNLTDASLSAGGNNGGGGSKADERRYKTPLEKLVTLKNRFRDEQTVQSVEGVCLVHLHRHPHVLLLRQTLQRNRDATGNRVMPPTHINIEVSYRLPGGRCRRGEAEEMCLRRKLGRHLLNEPKVPHPSASGPATAGGAAGAGGVGGGSAGVAVSANGDPNAESDTILDVGLSGLEQASTLFRVGELLGRWYRPHFSPLMYPYVPPHIALASVKEVRSVFLVHMEPLMYLSLCASNVELVAVPLFDLYDNAGKYGPILASLPAVLSRVLINYCNSEY